MSFYLFIFVIDSVFKEDIDKDDLRDFSLDLFGSKYLSSSQSAGKILTQKKCFRKNSFRIHFWDGNGMSRTEKESSVQ